MWNSFKLHNSSLFCLCCLTPSNYQILTPPLPPPPKKDKNKNKKIFQILHLLLIQPLLKNTKKDHSALSLIVYDRIELTSLKIKKKKKIYCSPRFLPIRRCWLFQFLKCQSKFLWVVVQLFLSK